MEPPKSLKQVNHDEHHVKSHSEHKKFVKATNAANAKVRYVPVPVPGQLMPIPKLGSKQSHEDLSKKNNHSTLSITAMKKDESARALYNDLGFVEIEILGNKISMEKKIS